MSVHRQLLGRAARAGLRTSGRPCAGAAARRARQLPRHCRDAMPRRARQPVRPTTICSARRWRRRASSWACRPRWRAAWRPA
ncbi:hypothetical protein AZ18_2889, partial [Bordetella bronchiseptica D993]